MADANRSGADRRAEDQDPERTQRTPAVQEVIDRWFSDSDDDQPQAGGGDVR